MTKTVERLPLKDGRTVTLTSERDGRFSVWVLRVNSVDDESTFRAISYHGRAHNDFPQHKQQARLALATFAEKANAVYAKA